MRVQKKIRTSFYFSSFPLVFLSTRSGEVGHRRLAESETFEVESCKNALGGRAANPEPGAARDWEPGESAPRAWQPCRDALMKRVKM